MPSILLSVRTSGLLRKSLIDLHGVVFAQRHASQKRPCTRYESQFYPFLTNWSLTPRVECVLHREQIGGYWTEEWSREGRGEHIYMELVQPRIGKSIRRRKRTVERR